MMVSSLRPFLIFLIILCIASCSIALEGISIDNPVLDVTPVPIAGLSPLSSKEVVSCERVAVSGLSRLKIGSLHGIHCVTLVPSVVIPEKMHSKIQICLHRNSSLGPCHCKEDDWRNLHEGVWSTIISPYEDRYIDLKFMDDISGSATVTVEVEFQRWRLFYFALGIVLWLLAPVVNSWVPFYYSSSMAMGVRVVVPILLFQGMKLLLTGRKNAFYLVIYGSLVCAGSFLLHRLASFVLSDEMHSSLSNPSFLFWRVTMFLLFFIALAEGGLAYWIVRKFVVSEDGTVDVDIAQFVKWAIRIIAVTSISQSTRDTPLATALICCCMTIGFLVTSIPWSNFRYHGRYEKGELARLLGLDAAGKEDL